MAIKEMPKKWILAGGGWNNPVILKFLKQYLSEKIDHVEIKIANEIGWDNIYMEAEIFAYLAVRRLYKLSISLPSVTGARIPSLGGEIYLPKI
jgi:anhydro-N-acetylmuramic acid kinase